MILERLRKELIVNISHELKTPLGIVKGFAEGLQDNVAYDKRDRYAVHILSDGVSFYFTVDQSIGEVGDNNVHE